MTDTATMRRPALFVAIAIIVGAVCVAAWLLSGPDRASGRAPSEQVISEAAEIVAHGFRAGDVVRIDPHWFTAPRQPIEKGAGSFAFPYDGFDFSGHPDPLHLLRFQRLWVVAAFDALNQDDSDRVGLPLEAVQTWFENGPVRVSLYEIPQGGLGYDLLRSLGKARVVRKNRRCRWDAAKKRHDCHAQDWKDVYVTLNDAGDATRQCIYAEPHPENSVLSISWPDVPMDGSLLVHTGFTQSAVRRTDGADTTLKLLVDGEVKTEWVEPKNDYVWRSTWVPGDGGTHEVRLEMSAPKVGWRQLCIDGAVVTASALAYFSDAPERTR